MGIASGGSNTPHWIRNDILDFLRAMSVKIAVENGKICKKTTWERDCTELLRFGLLKRRITLDWALSRRWREDLEGPPQTREQYSRVGRIWDLYIVNS